MTERTVPIKKERPGGLDPLLPLCPLLAVLVAAILFWGRERPVQQELPGVPEEPVVQVEQLVTAEQLARMTYTDSSLGELKWTLTEASVEELNRVLDRKSVV